MGRRGGIAATLVLVLVLWFVFGLLAPVHATPPDIHLAMVGNWRGGMADLRDAENPRPAASWHTPTLLNQLRKKYAETLVIGIGNECDAARPESYLLNGWMESELAEQCRLDVRMMGPRDFSIVKDWKRARPEFFGKIFTNIAASPGVHPFPGWVTRRRAGRNWGFACLISPEAFAESPLHTLGGYDLEDPIRAYHRLLATMPAVHELLVVCHLSQADLKRLQDVATRETRLIWVPTEVLPEAVAHRYITGREESVWLAPFGGKSLLTVRWEVREGGKNVFLFNRFPLENVEARDGLAFWPYLAKEFRQNLLKTGRVIHFAEHPHSRPYRFRASYAAEVVKNFMRSDIVMIGLDDEPWKQERFISPKLIFETVPPRYLREYTMTGRELKQIAESMFAAGSPLRPGVDGASFGFLNGLVQSARTGHKTIDERASYRVTFDSGIYAQPPWKKRFDRLQQTGKIGFTLWDAWFEELYKMPFDRSLVREGVVK
jgi:hypothetical protein